MALDLARFTGSERWFRHRSSPAVIYSEGVRHLAEEAGAYWLIDAIASHLVQDRALIDRRAGDERFDHLHFWYLTKHGDGSAVLEARADSDGEPVVTQEIEFTDFPLTTITIYAGTDGPGTPTKLFLPSEY